MASPESGLNTEGAQGRTEKSWSSLFSLWSSVSSVVEIRVAEIAYPFSSTVFNSGNRDSPNDSTSPWYSRHSVRKVFSTSPSHR